MPQGMVTDSFPERSIWRDRETKQKIERRLLQ